MRLFKRFKNLVARVKNLEDQLGLIYSEDDGYHEHTEGKTTWTLAGRISQLENAPKDRPKK